MVSIAISPPWPSLNAGAIENCIFEKHRRRVVLIKVLLDITSDGTRQFSCNQDSVRR